MGWGKGRGEGGGKREGRGWGGVKGGQGEGQGCKTLSLSRFLQTSPHLEGVGEGRELEVVLVKYLTETAIVGGVVNLLSVGPHLLVTTGYGVLHRLSWEGCFNSSLTINLNHVPFASDLLPESRG